MTTTTAWAPAQHDRDAFARVTAGLEQLDRGTPDRVVLSGLADAKLAAGDLITGIALCKPGVFNGYFEVTRDDLDAWAARFAKLYPDTFEPPMRLNHSWDIESVIAWWVALRVENRPDTALGGTMVPMLVGDMQLNGTPEENARIRAWIKSGKLKKVSAEFWPYRTNAGAEYPSLFAGAAFVDIPAAEGLGPITLRRRGGTLSATSDQEDPAVSAPTDTTAPPAGTEVPPAVDGEEVPPVIDGEPAEAAEGEQAADPDEVPSNLPDGEDPEAEDPPAGDEPPAGEVPPAGLAAQLRAAGSEEAAVLRIIEAEADRRATLRVTAETTLAKHTLRGVVTPGVRKSVEALLRHDDDVVRDSIAAILEATPSPVKLGAEVGNLSGAAKPSEDGVTSVDELRELSDRHEFGRAWAALELETRKDPAYLAVYREVMGTDYRPRV